MTHVGNNVYAVTIALGSGNYHEFKFINGNDWGMDETVPAACASGGNRFLIIPEVSTTLEAVCFGSCTPCGPPPVPVNVTFQVDMSNEVISPNGVHIAGGFQGWNPGGTPMTDQGNGIFTYTTVLPSGSYQEYKFVNGTSWDESENVPDECGNNNNRYLTVPQSDIVLDLVCYGMCEPCPGPEQTLITFQVDMSEETVSPDGVHLVIKGEIPPVFTLMEELENDIWTVTLPFSENDSINYKFANGLGVTNYEQIPPECRVGNPFDGHWRYFNVPAFDITLTPFCFAACEPCIPPVLVDVTFQVDMSNETVSPEGVHIAGGFQGWNTGSTPMIVAGDNIYTYTTQLIVGEYLEFKYINGTTWDDAEQVPGDCNQNGNRFLTVPDEAVVLDLVCFGACDECPEIVEITFNVDMSQQEVSPEGVHLVGDFQFWNPQATPMTHIGDDVYSVAVMLPAGSFQTYRYINGNSYEAPSIVENVPEECGIDDGFGGLKRFMDVPPEPTALDIVCFGYCGACPEQLVITLPAGWSGLSSYLMPENTDMEAVLSEILPELVIIQSMTAFYFPAAGINTIGAWEAQSAYQIKLSEEVTLTITGAPEPNKTLQLQQGWNLIPVIADEPVTVTELFANVSPDLRVIKAVADINLFWPEYNINTIGMLQPGKAYFVLMDAPGVVTFP
jgi:hypothetical protein